MKYLQATQTMLSVAKVAGFLSCVKVENHLWLFLAAPVKDTSDNDLKNSAFRLKATVFLVVISIVKGHSERQHIRVCVCVRQSKRVMTRPYSLARGGGKPRPSEVPKTGSKHGR